MTIERLITASLQSIPSKPFGDTHNLELTFKRETGTIIGTDSVGNEIEVSEPVTFKFSIVHKDRTPADTANDGVGYQFMVIYGRLLEYSPIESGADPRLLPDWIKFQDVAEAVLIDPATNDRETGKFKFLGTTQNRFEGVTRRFGSVIEGELTLTVGV